MARGRFFQDRGAGFSPGAGTPSGKRSAGTHLAVSVPSEGTARAAQLAPSAVTAAPAQPQASATRSVVDRVSPTTSLERLGQRRAFASARLVTGLGQV